MAESSTTYKKGRKPGPGRPKGCLNKTTRETKDALAVFVSNNEEKFEQWIQEVDDPAKRMDLVLRAMEYIRPKLARTENHHSGTIGVAQAIQELDGSV